MRKEDKEVIINSITEQLNNCHNFYLTDIANLDADKTSQLRRQCFNSQVKLLVVKNALLRKAMEKTGRDYGDLYSALKGTTAIFFTQTGNAPGKLLQEYASKKKTVPALKAAYVEQGFYVGADQLAAVASIKSKNELIADIVALLQSPIRNIVSALQNKAEQSQEAAPEAVAAEA